MKELIQIQQALKAPKGQTNKFGGYRYRSCEDILTAVKPLLAEHKLAILIQDDIVEVGGRVYVKATATIYGDAGAVVAQATAYARESETKKGMDDSQITGAASSYARKYALNGLLAIDDTKDADATNKHDKTKEKKRDPKMVKPGCISKEQAKRLYAVVSEKGWTKEQAQAFLIEFGGWESSLDVPQADYDSLVQAIRECGGEE